MKKLSKKNEDKDWRRMREKEYTEYWERKIAEEKQKSGGENRISGGKQISRKSTTLGGFWCDCLCELIIPIIAFLIIILIVLGSL